METIPIQDPRSRIAPDHFSLFAMGFRPFFLLAGLAGMLLVPLWLGLYTGLLSSPFPFSIVAWHSHEMLFGYGEAVVAGFLLTAVRNWTGYATLKNTPLALLGIVWLIPRLVVFLPGFPLWLLAVIDCAFPLLLIAALARPLLKAGKLHNTVLLLLLLIMACVQAAFYLWPQHASRIGWIQTDLLMVLITMIGGRVIGFFTERGLGMRTPLPKRPWLDRGLIWLMLLFTVAEAISLPSSWMAAFSLLLMTGHAFRLADWWSPAIFRVPLVWILQFGYAWIVIGFALRALSEWLPLSPVLSQHAFTIGALGSITLGMMVRVSLGHTGRELRIPRLVTGSFALLTLAAFVRVFLPWWQPEFTLSAIVVSGLLWTVVFATFVVVYTPVLIRARVDGQPG
jgi:uncharacterized protein involved in response to NO